jgi:hypothetical protein
MSSVISETIQFGGAVADGLSNRIGTDPEIRLPILNSVFCIPLPGENAENRS